MKIRNTVRLLVLGTAGLAFSACAPAGDTGDASTPLSEDDKMFYFLGTQLADSIRMNFRQLDLSDAELAVVARGVRDGLTGVAEDLSGDDYQARFEALARERVEASMQREAAASQAYLDEMAAEEGAVRTESGLIYRELKAGDGEQPLATSRVRAHYHGTLRDGTVFDSSVERGEPLEIGLAQVIPCWTEGIAMMKVGGKARLTCPPDIAYGPRGSGAIPPNAALTFEVELLDVL